jgi:hypothetical protein
VIDERKQRRELIERSIFASCAGDQQQARQLSAELVILATQRALPEIQRRGRETVANLRRFETLEEATRYMRAAHAEIVPSAPSQEPTA